MKKRLCGIAMAGVLATGVMVAPQATQPAHAAYYGYSYGSSWSLYRLLSYVVTIGVNIAVYNALVDQGLIRSLRR
ncbi:MAG: hypothetical protein Q3961_02835 [Bifidobacteriaceae bacterium]|nr:hypothetical protein [Bifidobacteriaceae bacterium]